MEFVYGTTCNYNNNFRNTKLVQHEFSVEIRVSILKQNRAVQVAACLSGKLHLNVLKYFHIVIYRESIKQVK